MRRALFSGLLAAICIALLLVPAWLRGPAVRDGEAPAAGAGSAVPMPAAVEPPGRAAAESERSAASTEPSRGEIASIAASAPTCLVRVVDAATKAPVPEARVWIQREDVGWDDPEWWRAMRRFNDVEPVLQSGLGEEHALDERGTLRVPRPSRALSVAAALGDLHGEAELEPDDAECVVELERYHALTVEVVDRAGEPVPHALVALFWGELDPLEGSHFLPTDEEGRLFVPKLEAQIWDEDYRGTLRLTLAGGVPCTPEIVELSMEDLPVEPVRLEAGDFGAVVVQLSDRFGRPQRVEGTAHLEIDTDRMHAVSLAMRGGASLYLPMQDGRAEFPCIGLNLPLYLGGSAQRGESSWREISGPTEPGEILEVLLPVADHMWSARLRVLGIEACFPGLRSALLQGFRGEHDDGFSGWVREGESAEVGLWRGGRYAPGEGEGPWTLELYAPGGRARASAVPALDSEQRIVEFGDVAFAPSASSVVHVRAVGEDGKPVPGASLEIENAHGMGFDANGRCALETTEIPARVRASHRSWLASPWITIDGSEAETELVLRRAARLEGRLLLPRLARASELDLELVGAEPVRTNVFEGGRFRFDACEPGSAVLIVHCLDERLAEQRVELVADETTVLADMDLRDALHPFAVTLELASGEPWQDGHLELVLPDGGRGRWTRIGPGGRASFLATTPSVDLWACGRGARPRFFEGVLDGDRLVLSDGYALAVRVGPSIELPVAPLALMLRAWGEVPDGAFEPDEDVDLEAMAVGADRAARLRVPYPGEYELEWYVLHTGTGVEFDVEPDEPQVVRVDEEAGGVVLDALLDAESVQRALRAARGE